MSLQQPIKGHCKIRRLKNPQADDVDPRSKYQGERPSELPFEMMRRCWGCRLWEE